MRDSGRPACAWAVGGLVRGLSEDVAGSTGPWRQARCRSHRGLSRGQPRTGS